MDPAGNRWIAHRVGGLAKFPILLGGELPERHQFFEVVVSAFIRFFIDQPDHPHLGGGLVNRQQASADGVVATGVAPHVRHGAQSQCADRIVGVITHQRCDLFAVHRLANIAVGQQRTVDGKPAVHT